MRFLDHSFDSPAENLACDEALLDACDTGGPEILRVWAPASTFVVLGYGNHVATEVHLERCLAQRVPVLRRVSGGGTVLQLPGVLNYAVILRTDRPETAGIPETNRCVLDQVAAALRPLLPAPLQRAGDTDLCLGPRKGAGNAQRRLRRSVLFHGSLLLDADLDRIADLLPAPSRAPNYREGRSHRDFLVNLHLPTNAVKDALRRAWRAERTLTELPQTAIASLVTSKYSREDWNLRR